MIIVTGGAGFIGSNIVNALNKKSIDDILIVDNLKKSIKFSNLVDLNIVDYIDKDDFLSKVRSGKKIGNIQAVFHEGACSSTIDLDGNYLMKNNYQYSKELLDYCLKYSIPFLYASSSAIYGNRISNFIESRNYEKPLNIYGYSKFLFDEHVRRILPIAKSQIVGFRYFNVYGPREKHKDNMASIVFQLNTQINNGEIPKLFEGSQNFKRDFVYINDVTSVNIWFLEKNISGIFNIGTGFAESFSTVANIVLSYHKKYNIEYIPFPKKIKNFYQKFTQADLTNLRLSGYNKPFKTISEGVIEYMNWLNCNS